jgi:hypothetical protein
MSMTTFEGKPQADFAPSTAQAVPAEAVAVAVEEGSFFFIELAATNPVAAARRITGLKYRKFI